MSALKFAAVGAPAAAAVYVEDVFSTYLYTGNGATQTITNGIDLSGQGGLVWLKPRSGTYGVINHRLYDTARGAGQWLSSNLTDANTSTGNTLTAFTSSGFTLDSTAYNASGEPAGCYASWTFREQPKFFDVVTYTGDGANRTIAHSLDAVPGSIIVKRTDIAANWAVYHRSLANTQYLVLNTTAAAVTGATWWNSTTPTSAVFSVGTDASVNASGGTYVAYIFAHDAGGFGLTGTDNVISCGSLTSITSTDVSVTLGYEPQFVLWKRAIGGTGNWNLADTTRGNSYTSWQKLFANTTAAEVVDTAYMCKPTATGFIADQSFGLGTGNTVIYIAIRRGPMKVPTTGTSVFSPALGSGTAPGYVSGFPVDFGIERNKGSVANTEAGSRLTGATVLQTNSTNVEANSINTKFDYMNGFFAGTKGATEIAWMFRRAPGFFDEVCYTGNGGNMTISHNLGVVPTLMIVKGRNLMAGGQWKVYDVFDGNDNYMALNTTAATASGYGAYWNTTTPTSTVFYVGSNNTTNTGTYIARLFATCPGVSKVGSYTGNGTTQTIACGFSTGARFILIKRTDAVGDWYVWDSARGIVAGNDPHLSLNTTAAEVTTDDSVDTDSAGFIVNQLAATNINVSAATYIFLSCS